MDYLLYKAEDFASDESFIRYYLRQDEQDVLFWKEWMAKHPEQLDEVLMAERLLDLLHVRLSETEREEELDRLKQHIGKNEKDISPAELNPAARKTDFVRWLKVAAVFLITGASALFFAKLINDHPITDGVKAVLIKRYNPYGQRSLIILSDGSKVTLNSGSELIYPKIFNGKTRDIQLMGEAFFEVAKDAKHPFIVHTENVTTTVLGTRFNVKSLPEKGGVKVSLVEGSVKLLANKAPEAVFLTPGREAVFLNNKFYTSPFDAEEVLAWKDGIVIFKNAGFGDVAMKLHQMYGIKLINKSNNRNWSYTGRFENTDYLTIIKTISFAKSLNYTVNNDTIILE